MSAPRAAPKALGATSSNASVARVLAPPATTRAGMAQRAIPTIPLNTYRGIAPILRCPYGTVCGVWPNRVVEREGVMKLFSVRFSLQDADGEGLPLRIQDCGLCSEGLCPEGR